jgi:hypothetical protein
MLTSFSSLSMYTFVYNTVYAMHHGRALAQLVALAVARLPAHGSIPSLARPWVLHWGFSPEGTVGVVFVYGVCTSVDAFKISQIVSIALKRAIKCSCSSMSLTLYASVPSKFQKKKTYLHMYKPSPRPKPLATRRTNQPVNYF